MTDRPAPQDSPSAEQHGVPSPGTTPSWTTWRPTDPQAPTTPTPAAQSGPPEATPAPGPASEASRPSEVTYLPAPSGPNWGLVVLGLLFVLIAGGVVANQIMGFQVAQLTEVGPNILVIGGLACAAVGAVGILARRR